MKPEDELLIACTRQDFQQAHQDRVLKVSRAAPLDWHYLVMTATRHNVAPIVYTNLVRCLDAGLGPPAEVLAQLQQSCFRNIALMSGLAVKLAKGLAFLREKSIDVMLIKGIALDVLVYKEPWYTVHDVDLVLSCRREELSPAQAVEIGHFMHRIPGVEYDYFEHHDIQMNGVLAVDFRRIWQDARRITYGSQPAWTMAPEDMLISICINSCRKRYFRLKALFDIAETVRVCSDLDWAVLCAKAADYGVSSIVYAALLAAQATLGCDLPDGAQQRLHVGRSRSISFLVRRFTERQSFADLFAGASLMGRPLDSSLLLPYVTYQPRQVGRKLAYLLAGPPGSSA